MTPEESLHRLFLGCANRTINLPMKPNDLNAYLNVYLDQFGHKWIFFLKKVNFPNAGLSSIIKSQVAEA